MEVLREYGNRRKKWTVSRVQILGEAVCISDSANNLEERYEPNYSPRYEQKVGQTGLFNLGTVTSLGEGKLWIKNW